MDTKNGFLVSKMYKIPSIIRGWTFLTPGTRLERWLWGSEIVVDGFMGVWISFRNNYGGLKFLKKKLWGSAIISIKNMFFFLDKYNFHWKYCIPFLAKTVGLRPIGYHDHKENHMLCLIWAQYEGCTISQFWDMAFF